MIEVIPQLNGPYTTRGQRFYSMWIFLYKGGKIIDASHHGDNPDRYIAGHIVRDRAQQLSKTLANCGVENELGAMMDETNGQ